MGAYLLDNPPRRAQYRNPRREEPSGVVVVHTAENAPDFVAFDGGAEAVARFIQGRADAGSYHVLADSDSILPLIPYDFEAFQDGTGSNRHAVGLSVATRADVWPLAPANWRLGAVENLAVAAADFAHWLHTRRGIVIPARRISRSDSELRMPGFISHGERDPGRRHDPGASFPWDFFLERYALHTADLGNEPTGDDDVDEATLRRVIGEVLDEKLGTDSAPGENPGGSTVIGRFLARMKESQDNLAKLIRGAT